MSDLFAMPPLTLSPTHSCHRNLINLVSPLFCTPPLYIYIYLKSFRDLSPVLTVTRRLSKRFTLYSIHGVTQLLLTALKTPCLIQSTPKDQGKCNTDITTQTSNYITETTTFLQTKVYSQTAPSFSLCQVTVPSVCVDHGSITSS
jgi:hypothetical protein